MCNCLFVMKCFIKEHFGILRVLLVMFVVLSFVSCDSEEEIYGDWELMVWKSEELASATDGVYDVSAHGGEFTFSCSNYSSPWIADASSNGVYYYTGPEANDYHSITTDWFKAEMNGNRLNVVFEANETDEERPLRLTVTAGDVFYSFNFKQSK